MNAIAAAWHPYLVQVLLVDVHSRNTQIQLVWVLCMFFVFVCVYESVSNAIILLDDIPDKTRVIQQIDESLQEKAMILRIPLRICNCIARSLRSSFFIFHFLKDVCDMYL